MWMQWFGTCIRNQREVRDQKGWLKKVGKMSSIEAQFEEIERQDGWYNVYNALKTKGSKQTTELTTHEGKKSDNRVRNRFRDVLPYDQTRAVIRCCTTDATGGECYINASLVTVADASRSYICAQGPLPGTVSHFWEMIWQYNCAAIVMLNSLIEKGMPTCAIYWPSEMNAEMVLDDSQTCHEIAITLTKETINPVFVIREFTCKRRVKDGGGGDIAEERRIVHYHFTNWPDFGVPDCPNAFMDFMLAVRQSGCYELPPGKDRSNPMVVHCTAGIGRTGAFVLVDVCLSLLSLYRTADIQARLLELRQMRMGFVQTPEQLRFCYQAIILGKKALAVQTPAVSPDLKHRPAVLNIKSNSDTLTPADGHSPTSPRRELLRQEGRTPSTEIFDLNQKRQKIVDEVVAAKAFHGSNHQQAEHPQILDPTTECDRLNLLDKRDEEIRQKRLARNEKLREKIDSIKHQQKLAAEATPWKVWVWPVTAVAAGVLGAWIAWNRMH